MGQKKFKWRQILGYCGEYGFFFFLQNGPVRHDQEVTDFINNKTINFVPADEFKVTGKSGRPDIEHI